MARRKVIDKKATDSVDYSKKKRNSRLPDDDDPTLRLALTIPEFCVAFRISDDFYYKLKRQHEGPREMKVGKRTLISMEAAKAWRIAREEAAVAKAKQAAEANSAASARRTPPRQRPPETANAAR